MFGRFSSLALEMLVSIGSIIGLLLFFQFAVFRRPLERWPEVTIGLVLATVGIISLVYGLKLGVVPLGESVAAGLAGARSTWLILAFAFLVGLVVTYTEPALQTMAAEIDTLSSGAMSQHLFITTVALGIGTGTLVGSTRILYGIQATHYFIPFLAVMLVLTYFAPERYTALAYDAAFATTGPMTVTLVIALGTGLATALGRSDTLLYGFGLVTMAAIGPIISILLLGIILGRMGA